MARWKPIPEFPSYEVSDLGEVRRSDTHRPVKASGHNGYLRVTLRGATRRQRPKRFVHRLVLQAFVGPGQPGQEVRHLNDVPTDNRLANLAWGWPVENAQDKVLNGARGQGVPIPDEVVARANELHEAGMTWLNISGLLGWSVSSLRKRVYRYRQERGHR